MWVEFEIERKLCLDHVKGQLNHSCNQHCFISRPKLQFHIHCKERKQIFDAREAFVNPILQSKQTWKPGG